MANDSSRISKRSEISSEYKWKLEDIYASNDLWEEDYKKVKQLAEKLSEYKTSLDESSTKLLECLNASTEMMRLFEKVYVYAQMKSHEDTANAFYQGLADRSDSLSVEVSSADSFIVPGILAIPDDKLNAFIGENEDLQFYSV